MNEESLMWIYQQEPDGKIKFALKSIQRITHQKNPFLHHNGGRRDFMFLVILRSFRGVLHCAF